MERNQTPDSPLGSVSKTPYGIMSEIREQNWLKTKFSKNTKNIGGINTYVKYRGKSETKKNFCSLSHLSAGLC